MCLFIRVTKAPKGQLVRMVQLERLYVESTLYGYCNSTGPDMCM